MLDTLDSTRRSILFFLLLLGVAVAAPAPLSAQSNEEAVEAPKTAAQEWLAFFDDEKYV